VNRCITKGDRPYCDHKDDCEHWKTPAWASMSFCQFESNSMYCTNMKAISAAIWADGRSYLECSRNTPDTDRSPECPRCGNVKECNGEPDQCLGLLPGVVDACCGHGSREQSYVHFQNGIVLEGFVVGAKMEEPDSVPLWVLNESAIEAERVEVVPCKNVCITCAHYETDVKLEPCKSCSPECDRWAMS
jgi:hypothetical protein